MCNVKELVETLTGLMEQKENMMLECELHANRDFFLEGGLLTATSFGTQNNAGT